MIYHRYQTIGFYGIVSCLTLDIPICPSILKKVTAMDIDLAQKSLNAALSGNWKEATKLNREILKKDPKDIDALNRMARAFAELGNLKRAKSLTQKVLKIDPFNTIAERSIKNIKAPHLVGFIFQAHPPPRPF